MTAALTMRKREFHAATARSTDDDGARQMLAGYANRRYAAVIPNFKFEPGYVYTQVRAISARINQNYDGWPSSELKKSYRSFIGKPIFVNHQNFDPTKARGKVVAARYVEAGDDKYIETVMQVDAQRFPKLAKEIKEGGLDSVSMGVEAGFTICSVCNNKAVDTPDFCDHVRFHKGQKFRTASGEETLVYEKCYKLGFFELSYVFDPADETAVVSRVISAANHDTPEKSFDPYPEDEELFPEIHPSSFDRYDQGPRHHRGDDPKTYIPREAAGGTDSAGLKNTTPKNDPAKPAGNGKAPAALKPGVGPKAPKKPKANAATGVPMGTVTIASLEHQIHRHAFGEIEAPEDVDTLRHDPEDKDDDFLNMVDSPKELQTPDMDQAKRLDRAQEDQGLDADRRVEDIEDVGGAMPQRAARHFLVDPRTGRRYYAADDAPPDPSQAPPPPPPGGDPSMGDPSGGMPPGGPPPPGGDPFGGPPPGGPPGGDPSMAGGGDVPPMSDDQLIQQAEQDLAQFQMQEDPDPGSDAGGSADDFSDPGGDAAPDPSGPDAGLPGPPPSDGGDVPPWMQDGSDPDQDPTDPSADPKKTSRRNGFYSTSSQNKRRTNQGGPMSFASRNRVAAAQAPRHHYAGDDGHTDGGPYHTDDNDQGVQEEVYLSQTPGAEAVSAPTPGDGTISNGKDSLVKGAQYITVNGRRYYAFDGEQGQLFNTSGGQPMYNQNDPSHGTLEEGVGLTSKAGRRYYADSVEQPDTVNPPLSGTDDQSVKSGDWDNIALDDVQTQPKDASKHAFAAFDRWVQQTTGKTARQHNNATFIRRCAARYCQGTGVDVQSLFPILGNVLREARRNEGANKGAKMRRRADESLEVAAPQDRIDVEAPVRDTTDADAQASQFDLGDFGSNASDNLADPDLSADSQIFAPGEGKTSRRKADGITAVRYAEAYIRAGLAPVHDKFKIAGLAQTMRHGTIVDRIRLLDAINQNNAQRAASARRTAGVNRGAGSVPPGFGQRQLSAGRSLEAANDLSDDVGIWLK